MVLLMIAIIEMQFMYNYRRSMVAGGCLFPSVVLPIQIDDLKFPSHVFRQFFRNYAEIPDELIPTSPDLWHYQSLLCDSVLF